MILKESEIKRCCDECGKYDYIFEIHINDDEYETLKLCKQCLLKLLKMIIER